MSRKKRKRTPTKKPDEKRNDVEPAATEDTEAVPDESGGINLRRVALFAFWALVAVHLVIIIWSTVNRISTPVITSRGDPWYAHVAYQVGVLGEHPYRMDDIHLMYHGYTPLTFYLYGAVFRVLGVDLRYLRGCLLLVMLAVIVLTALMIRKRTNNNRLLVICGVMMILACDRPHWFLMIYGGMGPVQILCVLAAIMLLSRNEVPSWLEVGLALIACFLAYWSKQTGLAYMVAGPFYVLIKDWRKGVAMLLGSVGLFALSTWYYANLPNSSFIWCVFQYNRSHPMEYERLWEVFCAYFAGRWGMTWLLILGMIVATPFKWKKYLKADYVFLGAAFVASVVSWIKRGSGENQAYTLYALMAIVAMHAAHELSKRRVLVRAILPVLLLIQIGALLRIREFRNDLVYKEDVKRYERIMRILGTPGAETYYADHGFLNLLLKEKKTLYGNVAQEKTWTRGRHDPNACLPVWRKTFEDPPWDIIITDVPLRDGSQPFYEMLVKYYQQVPAEQGGVIPADPLRQSSSFRRTKLVFVRKQAEQPPPDALPGMRAGAVPGT